jgi:hypothetical protein
MILICIEGRKERVNDTSMQKDAWNDILSIVEVLHCLGLCCVAGSTVDEKISGNNLSFYLYLDD